MVLKSATPCDGSSHFCYRGACQVKDNAFLCFALLCFAFLSRRPLGTPLEPSWRLLDPSGTLLGHLRVSSGPIGPPPLNQLRLLTPLDTSSTPLEPLWVPQGTPTSTPSSPKAPLRPPQGIPMPPKATPRPQGLPKTSHGIPRVSPGTLEAPPGHPKIPPRHPRGAPIFRPM